MAAEASRAPIAVRERPNASAIEWVSPTVNDLCDALDQASCLADRLGVLVRRNLDDFLDVIEKLPNGDGKNRLYPVWMVATLASEKLTEIQEVIAAITQRAYEERAAVTA